MSPPPAVSGRSSPRRDRPALRLAVAQFDAENGDVAKNVRTHARLIREAGDRGVDLVLFPELSLSGYAATRLDEAPERCAVDPSGPELEPIRSACRAGRTAAVVGGAVVGRRGLCLSSIVVDREGGAGERYDKQYLHEDERGWFVPGDEGCVFELDGWRLGLGICYDASFPEHARSLAAAGADAYLVSGAFPVGDSDRRRAVYFPARALENTVYVAFANFVGSHDALSYCGRSAVYAPDGTTLAAADATDSGLTIGELDPGRLEGTRRSLRMLADRPGGPTAVRTGCAL